MELVITSATLLKRGGKSSNFIDGLANFSMVLIIPFWVERLQFEYIVNFLIRRLLLPWGRYLRSRNKKD
jgi:hypothetical protein